MVINDPPLGARFREALDYATSLHETQMRKGTAIPYVAHLLGVASLVLEDGGDEDEAIAALLHDAVEDQGGRPTLRAIKRRFGDHVASIVEGCTDTDTFPKPPWRTRKENYIEHLRAAPPEVRRVSLADKLHNARSILWDYRLHGSRLWKRFGGGREGTLWYYEAIVKVFREVHGGPMVDELERVVGELMELCEEER